MSDLIERLNALHVWPQIVADNHADILTPRQIKHLYEVGAVATEAADRIEALTDQLAEAQSALQTAMTELNGHKDALAQVPEFICRKCGKRQDGPTDNEARF